MEKLKRSKTVVVPTVGANNIVDVRWDVVREEYELHQYITDGRGPHIVLATQKRDQRLY